MYKKVTKFIMNQMDPCKEWVPVKNIADNEYFRPLCLVIKKRKSNRMFHRRPYFDGTRFTLADVLLPGEDGKSIESILQDSSQFTLKKTSDGKADGGLKFTADPAKIGMKGGAYMFNDFSITTEKKTISLESLEALRRERKINTQHSFIQQLPKRDIDLHLVIEILEAAEEAEYKKSTKADGGFKAKIYGKASAKGTRKKTKGIVIPKGCTLAFRTIPIRIRDGAWGPSLGNLGVVLTEVEYSCRIFPELSPDLLLIILNTIKAGMRDKNLLQELSQKMEEVPEQKDGYELKTESPGLQALFNTLKHSSGDHLLQLAEGITYVLDALHELMEDQLRLLLESLERKIVSQQLNLVANLLEYDVKNRMEHFHVDASLLSFPQKEEQRLTLELVELSGVQLQEDGSAISRNKPFEAMAALFVALYALKLLSGSK